MTAELDRADKLVCQLTEPELRLERRRLGRQLASQGDQLDPFVLLRLDNVEERLFEAHLEKKRSRAEAGEDYRRNRRTT